MIRYIAIINFLRMEGREARSSSGRPWPAGDSRPRSRRGPRVKPSTPDPASPSGRDPLASAILTAQQQSGGGVGGSGRAAGLTLGGGSAQSAPPSPGRNHCTLTTRPTVSRASRPARAERSGSAHSRMQRRRVRALGARLEAVQKVLTTQDVVGDVASSGRSTLRQRITTFSPDFTSPDPRPSS